MIPIQTTVPERLSKSNKQGDRRSQKKLTGQITDQDRVCAERKLRDQSKYPSMTAREVAAVLGISRNAVYDHPLLEKHPTGNRRRLYTTASGLVVLNSPPR